MGRRTGNDFSATVSNRPVPKNSTMKFARFLSFPFVLLTLAVAFTPTRVHAQTGPQLLLEPFPKDLRLDMTADASVTAEGHAKGTDADLQIGIVEASGRFRLNPGDIASPRIGFGSRYMAIGSDLPSLPNDLYDLSIGFATPIAKVSDWIIGFSIGIGYAGETPFSDGNGFYGRASIGAFKQIDETSGLALLIDYDGNRLFKPDMPLPGFVYFKRIDQTLSLSAGIPLVSIEWKPTDALRIELTYLLIDNYRARVGYRLGGGFEVFGAVLQRSDAYFIEGQRYGDDRLIFQQRRAELGLTYRVMNNGVGERDVELTVAAGYAFMGEFSVGFDGTDSRLLTDISDEPYVRAALQMRF
jgi:hypothetical protein